MDTQHYSSIIKQILTQYANYLSSDEEVKAQVVFDDERNHYLLLEMGWQNKKYIYQLIMHLTLIDGKVWIQQDYTEAGIVDELIEMGIPPAQIVLGFRHPKLRQYTGFAVA